MTVVNYQNRVQYQNRMIVEKPLASLGFIRNEFIFGGHWLSLSASGIALTMMMLLGMSIHWEFLFIAYLGTHCIYNYNHYKELEIDSSSNSPRAIHLNKYKKFYPFIIISYGLLFFSFLLYFGNLLSIIFGSLLLMLGLLYTSDGKKMSKHVVGFKSIYTAISWSMLIIFTAIYCSYPLNAGVFLFLLFVALRMIMDTSFFDIKDIERDREEGLLTLPMIVQKKSSWLNFLHLLNFISFGTIIIGTYMKILPVYSLFFLFIVFYSFYYIQKAKNEKADIHFLSYFLVDGEYAFWPVVLFAGSLFLI